jgi:hypothetical protein
MAKAVISDRPVGKLKSITASNSLISKILFKSGTVKVTQTLPFRVKITNIGVPSYSATNAPPVGIAIIGFNNYIL